MAEKYKIDMPETVTDEQIDALMDDWFDRDGDTYVHKRKDGRLGWEKSLEADSAYSEWMLSAPTEKELITRAYSLGRDTIVAMDLPHPVQVRISKKESCTDGKQVFIATKVFDEKGMDTSEKLDVFLGLAIHEGCHVLWTNFGIRMLSDSRLYRSIANVLEDERIETLCGEERPGFANFLEKSKAYYFDLYYKRVTEKKLEESGTLLEKFFDMFLKIIRYPKYLDENLIIKFYKYLVRIKDVLTPYPDSTESVHKAAKKIEEIILEFYADEMTKEEKRKAEEKRKSAGEKGEGGKSSAKGSGDPDSGEDDSEESEEGDGSEKSEGEREEGDGTGSADGDEGEEGEEETRVYAPGDWEVRSKLAEDASKDSFKETERIFAPEKSEGERELSDEVKRDREFAEVVEGSITLGSTRDVIFTKAELTSSSTMRYQESLDRVRRFVPAISKVLKAHAQEYRYILHGMRSGKLDTGKLAEAFQGVPTVYLREGEVKTDKISVCLLVDESGSMGGMRERAARDTAVLINEAIGSVANVDLFIYGHTGDIRRTGTTEITIYKEHGFDSRKALGSISAKCQNRDGTAIYETARRVRKQTKENVLMFVISDGAQAALGYYGGSAIEHTRQMVVKAEGMGFSIVQICINPCYDPKLMFRHFVTLTNMETLSLDLNKVVKAALLKVTKKKML